MQQASQIDTKKTQAKKTTDKQQKQPKAAAPEVALSDCSQFEQHLRKQIRNRSKKLDQIQELELKLKDKKEKFEPNDAQKAKLAQKEALKALIDEITETLSIYQQERKDEARKKRESAQQQRRELKAAQE